ncbi:hypothetical protein WT15_12370 [Burkholderia stagnalis]|uniref:hypothetical protein n=1 Tax=Burkholderia stagnalis TaxID=1503054 RepID=UPI000754A6E9|nr:hypothetical protein [Burkholderia stagnalis]AOK54931.1 hypothetical protein WT74_19225 [Burkholderia stagnalis]KVN80249.1 hypothetical protein WT15_12370 [Burkholderia stagnalis]KWO28289.1 hypothetical protein WT95_20910 [Burkholderia stagnalis]KWO30843.1 hypothetical protein WT96_24435 [Burkholderia stagnalis]
MKPIAWMIMAACLALTACGGDDVATNGGASLSTPATPGTPSNPSPPTGGGPGGGGSQATAGWSKAAAMDGKAPEFEPSVTIDASGNALVSWMTSGTGNGNAMWGARYVPGSGWSAATRLDTSDGTHPMSGPGTIQPQLVGNASGQAVAFWTEWMPGPNAYALWARPYSPGTGWGVPFEVAPNVTSATYSAGIDKQGNAIVAWPQEINLLNSRIAWTRYSPGGTWSPTALIQMPVQTGPGAITGDTDNVGPMISVLPSGNAVLAWRQTNHTRSALWTGTYDPANGWTNVGQVVSNTSLFTTIISPVAGMDAKGNITLVWGQLDVTGGKFLTTTMSQRYVSGTGWQTAQAVAPALAETSSFIGAPLLTVNETGMAAVMWPQLGGALQASVADATGNWGPLHQLTAHLDSTAGQYPPLVIDAAGNVTAAWQDVGASSSPAVVAASYRNGAWSASTLSGQDSQSAYWPALAVNAAGAMALVWASTVQNVGTLLQASFYTPGS